jgi:hypothetical protein
MAGSAHLSLQFGTTLMIEVISQTLSRDSRTFVVFAAPPMKGMLRQNWCRCLFFGRNFPKISDFFAFSAIEFVEI